mmetsp:Transcript_6322/g.15730  ORF Transcript_6322/g.15730 Transcript_6322/m.15730 type:complete len:163 (-) Transcript_6322:1219-1707(-)
MRATTATATAMRCRRAAASLSPTQAKCSYGLNSAIFTLRNSVSIARSNTYAVVVPPRQRRKSARYTSASSKPPHAANADASSSVTNPRAEMSPVLNPLLSSRNEIVDVGAIAESLGVRLTACERELLRKKLDFYNDGRVTCDSFRFASQRALEERTIREICL